jgi:sulfur carrier protein
VSDAARAPGGAPASGGPGGEPTGAATVRVTVNGHPRELPAGTTVAELLQRVGATGRPCAVEIGHTIVPRSLHATHRLADGDSIEVVGFVGGG